MYRDHRQKTQRENRKKQGESVGGKDGAKKCGNAGRPGMTSRESVRGKDGVKRHGNAGRPDRQARKENVGGKAGEKRGGNAGRAGAPERQENVGGKAGEKRGGNAGRPGTPERQENVGGKAGEKRGGSAGRPGAPAARENSRGKAGGAGLRESRVKGRGQASTEAAGCPYSRQCGGCDYQGIPYEKQLVMKQSYLQKLLKPFGKVEPIVGMDNPYHYRCKVQAAFDYVKGNVVAGTYKKNTHEVVDLPDCLIENQEATAIIQSVKKLLRSFRIRTFDEDTGYGLLRHVLVRVGYYTGEIMVVLVLSSPILPSKNNFVKALRSEHPKISTVVINVNDRHTSMVLGERNIVLYGRGYIEDRLCGLTFRISPNSFYQVNPVQTELLYQKAIEYANLSGTERVIDAYCGTGTIGLIAAGRAREVIGVEQNRDAIRDAVTNASRNDIRNIRFYNEDAGKFMVALAEQGEKADVVILDPPRTGSDRAFLDSVVKLAPKRVVYVSCGPETLARDLEYLIRGGYRVERCAGFDCFAFTKHVETVVKLSLKKDTPKIEVTMEPNANISNYKPKERVTYQKIIDYVKEQTGLHIHTSYIAQIKEKCGLDKQYTFEKEEGRRVSKCPPEKEVAIMDAFRHFGWI